MPRSTSCALHSRRSLLDACVPPEITGGLPRAIPERPKKSTAHHRSALTRRESEVLRWSAAASNKDRLRAFAQRRDVSTTSPHPREAQAPATDRSELVFAIAGIASASGTKWFPLSPRSPRTKPRFSTRRRHDFRRKRRRSTSSTARTCALEPSGRADEFLVSMKVLPAFAAPKTHCRSALQKVSPISASVRQRSASRRCCAYFRRGAPRFQSPSSGAISFRCRPIPDTSGFTSFAVSEVTATVVVTRIDGVETRGAARPPKRRC